MTEFPGCKIDYNILAFNPIRLKEGAGIFSCRKKMKGPNNETKSLVIRSESVLI